MLIVGYIDKVDVAIEQPGLVELSRPEWRGCFRDLDQSRRERGHEAVEERGGGRGWIQG